MNPSPLSSDKTQMAPVKLGVRGQTRDGAQLLCVYTLELDGEISRSVAPADQVEALLACHPDSWLSDGFSMVALRDGEPFGSVELLPLFAAAR